MYCIILIAVPCVFYYFAQLPTNAQLIHKLSHSSYMFRHHCIILRELVVNCKLIVHLLVIVQHNKTPLRFSVALANTLYFIVSSQ